MTALTRRTLLAGAAAFGAAALLDRAPALAATPPAGKQAPGFYRYKVGDYEITQVADGARTFPMPDGFVGNVKKEEALAAASERADTGVMQRLLDVLAQPYSSTPADAEYRLPSGSDSYRTFCGT